MRRKSYQIVGDRLTPVQAAASGPFVTNGELGPGSAIAHETFSGSFAATPVAATALNSRPGTPGMLPTKQRGKPKETSPPRQNGALRHRDLEVVEALSAADEILLTEQQLASRWHVSPKDVAERQSGRPTD
jgi:hypothetical protein